MPVPFAHPIPLSDFERGRLEELTRASSTPQALAFRCRLIVRAAATDQPTNGQIAAEFHCDRHTVALWRERFRDQGLAGLQDHSAGTAISIHPAPTNATLHDWRGTYEMDI
jgi:hypothetical protein